VKLAAVIAAVLAAVPLAACQGPMSLEAAQLACTKKGGLLTIFYSQIITRGAVGAVRESPGECIMPEEFTAPPPVTAAAPSVTN